MTRKRSILAIDPGVREIGVAHFVGNELVDYGVKSLRRPGNARRRLEFLGSVITRILDEKHPDVVAMEKNQLSRMPGKLTLLAAIQCIRKLVAAAGITLHEFAASTIKKEATGDGRATKRHVARAMCARIPELTAYREPSRKWRERYYQNMFDAVACGLAYIKLHAEKRIQ